MTKIEGRIKESADGLRGRPAKDPPKPPTKDEKEKNDGNADQ